MLRENLKKALRFYFITDDAAPKLDPVEQVKIAIMGGATIIQYRNKSFSTRFYEEAAEIRNICRCNNIPFIVNDNILLARSLMADGVHIGQDDEPAELARKILGNNAVIGISVSTLEELGKTDLSECDYIGAGPVFDTKTKPDAKRAIGPEGLESFAINSSVPVVAIGGIDQSNARTCFSRKAAGVAVISSISRAENPLSSALALGGLCSCPPRSLMNLPWNDEFGLIEKLLKIAPAPINLIVPPGDDACLLAPIANPVITTDTQREGIHFRSEWQTPREIGIKAVEVTFSDLAASFAKPVVLFINLCLPPYISENTVEEIYDGIRESLIKHECSLGGGNISAGSELSLDLFAIGRGRSDIFPKRSNAKAGFGLYCTGPLGLARAGLESLMNNDASFSDLVSKFKFPAARFDAAQILAEAGIDCVMDISDGLAGDAGHIAKASGITIELDLSSCPFDPDLVAFSEKYGKSPEETALSGGEDYELLFACHPDIYNKISNLLKGSFRAGTCVHYTGKHVISPPGIGSFQHGKRS